MDAAEAECIRAANSIVQWLSTLLDTVLRSSVIPAKSMGLVWFGLVQFTCCSWGRMFE